MIQVDVPFTFVVRDTTLPAGKYDVKAFDDLTPGVIELRSVKGHTAVVVDTENAQTRDDQAASKTELVFNKVGDQYFLSQVWIAGSEFGSELVKSRMEKRLEGGSRRPERHSIAGILRHLKP